MPNQIRKTTHTRITANQGREIEKLKRRSFGGSFDPNEDPVILGSGATSGTGTPTAPGTGSSGSVTIGLNAQGGHPDAIAIGDGAGVAGDDGIAIGLSAVANASHAVAVGPGSFADLNATAVGRLTSASGSKGTAVGYNASDGGQTHSTAVGAQALCTKDNQVMLGSSADFVEIPGNGVANGLVLTDTATGTRYIVQITSGALVLNTAP